METSEAVYKQCAKLGLVISQDLYNSVTTLVAELLFHGQDFLFS